jgi:general secretion pathway protein D
MTRRPTVPITLLLTLVLALWPSAAAQAQEGRDADTPQYHREHDELVIRTFYLENAEVKDLMTVLRSLIEVKRIATGETLNAITLRDTPGKMAIAEQLVRRHDKPRAEVEVAVELLTLDPEALARTEDGPPPLRLAAGELERLKRSAEAQVLAAPRLSALDGKRARLVLGEAVPLPAGAHEDGEEEEGEPASPAVQYQEVGLELELVPRVHPGSAEVTLELRLGLSGAVAGSTGDAYPVIARRSLDLATRLGDGETALLSGLLEVQPQPGTRLASLPLLASAGDNRREVAVALTLHIVRLPKITEEDRRQIPVGTETRLELGGGG